MAKRIVICDDHLLFLSGISELLKKANPTFQISSFSEVESCKAHIIHHGTDIFICDLNINNSDGFELIEELKHHLKPAKTIILTAYYEDFLIQKAKKMGLAAFLKKESTAQELIDVIESDMTGSFYVNGKGNKRVDVYGTMDSPVINKFRISKQEKEVIKLIIQGLTSKEIAEVLFVSKTTVDTHRKNIHKKLEISNSSSLIKFAHENNLLN